MSNFKIQSFRNLENVNADNMTTFYNTTAQQLDSLFPVQPSICNGIGNILNNFGQIGTSNVFAFINGVIRFSDQIIPVLSVTAPCFTTYNSTSVTITSPSSPMAQYYIVANLTFTAVDTYTSQTNVTILSTAMTLAEIAAETNPLAFVPICAITNTSGVYTVFIDSNCIYNYGLNFGVTSLVNSDASGNISIVNATPTGCNLISGTGHIIQPPNGRAYSGNPSGAQTGGSATLATLADIPSPPTPISIIANGSTRAYYTGGSATVTDPTLTFVYLSELPIINQVLVINYSVGGWNITGQQVKNSSGSYNMVISGYLASATIPAEGLPFTFSLACDSFLLIPLVSAIGYKSPIMIDNNSSVFSSMYGNCHVDNTGGVPTLTLTGGQNNDVSETVDINFCLSFVGS